MHEQEVEDSDRLLVFELGEFVHDLALEVGFPAETDRQQLNRSYLLDLPVHLLPPLFSVIVFTSAISGSLLGFSWQPRLLLALGSPPFVFRCPRPTRF